MSGRGPAFGVRTSLALGLFLLPVIVMAFGWLAGETANELLLYLPGIDKVLHFTAFAVLFLAGDWLLQRVAPDLGGGRWMLAGVLVLVSIADEAAQGLQPGRTVEAADLVASLGGVLSGAAWTVRRQHRRLAAVACSAGLLAAGTVTAESYATDRYINQAVWHARAGEFRAARHDYQMAIEAGADPARLYNELAWVEIESGVGNPRQAVEWSREALDRHPDDPGVLDTHGWALYHAGRESEALQYLERAYAGDPDIYCVHYHLGLAYLAVGDRARAEWHLREQVKLEATREASMAAAALRRMGAR